MCLDSPRSSYNVTPLGLIENFETLAGPYHSGKPSAFAEGSGRPIPEPLGNPGHAAHVELLGGSNRRHITGTAGFIGRLPGSGGSYPILAGQNVVGCSAPRGHRYRKGRMGDLSRKVSGSSLRQASPPVPCPQSVPMPNPGRLEPPCLAIHMIDYGIPEVDGKVQVGSSAFVGRNNRCCHCFGIVPALDIRPGGIQNGWLVCRELRDGPLAQSPVHAVRDWGRAASLFALSFF